jgi:hypothetical protein
LACRPYLIDLNELANEDLRVSEFGVQHSSAIMPYLLRIRDAIQGFANEVRKSVFSNGIKPVDDVLSLSVILLNI